MSQKTMEGSFSSGSATYLSRGDEGREEGTDDDAAQHERDGRIFRTHTQDEGQCDGCKTEGKRRQKDRMDAAREEDCKRRAEPCPVRDSQRVGRSEWVAEQSLEGGAGGGESGPDQHRTQGAGDAHVQHEGLRDERPVRFKGEKPYQQDAPHVFYGTVDL